MHNFFIIFVANEIFKTFFTKRKLTTIILLMSTLYAEIWDKFRIF